MCSRLQFDTYDYHSGIKQITWELKDMKDGTLHGDGSVAVIRTNVCTKHVEC